MEQSIDSTPVEAIVSADNATTTSPASLLILNDHCLLEISKYLGLFSMINLSKTCRRLKTLAQTMMFKKFSEFYIDHGLVYSGGLALVHEVLSHVGSHVVKLTCILKWDIHQEKVKHFWSIINNKCQQLKHVEISMWIEQFLQNFTEINCFDGVTSLSLYSCNFHRRSNFLASFRALNHLTSENSVQKNELTMMLRNNRNLTSCGFVEDYFSPDEMDLRWIEMVPNLEGLLIEVPRKKDYTLLSKRKLKKLELRGCDDNINQLLIQLDEHECMEELVLGHVQVDIRSMNILKSKFSKLRCLKFDYGDTPSHDFHTLPIGWPENLTKLTLAGVPVSSDMYLATFRHLKRLEKFDLYESFGADESNEEKFFGNDLVQQTLNAISHPHKITVVLPTRIHGSCPFTWGRSFHMRYLFDSDQLRIINYELCWQQI